MSRTGHPPNIGPGSTATSYRLHEEASSYSPRGVQGDGKYYPPYPHYWQRASGAHIWDVDGNEYIDYWCGASPVVLGHSHPAISAAVKRTLDEVGELFCAPHVSELELTKLLRKHIPSAEMSAYGCGGTDAIIYAIRAARSYTGRSKILRFEGSYHGWYDDMLFSFSPDPSQITEGVYAAVPDSTGLPPAAALNVLVAPYNDADAAQQIVEANHDHLAAIIVEPVSHTMGVVLPEPGFLERLRQLADAFDIVLIFDEIITGFRHGLGGAEQLFGIRPDLTAFGKAMSNGFPISAVSGKAELISQLAPAGPAYYSGTFNGNPICVAAAIATISTMEAESVHQRLFELGAKVADGVNAEAKRYDVKAYCQQWGSIWSVYFADRPVRNYRELLQYHNPDANIAFVHAMWREGIFGMPRRANRWYISSAHSDEDIERTIAAVGRFFNEHKSALREDSN